LQDAPDTAAMDVPQAGSEQSLKEECKMEKPADAEALRAEYLELTKTMWVTCLKGIRRAKAHMVGTFLGMLVTQSALLGALYFLEDTAINAILVIVVLLTLWWLSTFTKEKAVHEGMKREYNALEKRMKSIEREYLALTGTELRGTFTATEVQQAFDPLFKKYGLKTDLEL
jgi:hypothetical protein